MLLDRFEADGIDCVFASPIAVMAPIWEELASRNDSLRLRYFRCRHELLAVGAALGFYQITGRPQVAFLPTNLGVQNGSLGLRSAMQEHVPMVVVSIDSMTWGEDPNTDPGPEWPSLLSHIAGPARSGEAVVKSGQRLPTRRRIWYTSGGAHSISAGSWLARRPRHIAGGRAWGKGRAAKSDSGGRCRRRRVALQPCPCGARLCSGVPAADSDRYMQQWSVQLTDLERQKILSRWSSGTGK